MISKKCRWKKSSGLENFQMPLLVRAQHSVEGDQVMNGKLRCWVSNGISMNALGGRWMWKFDTFLKFILLKRPFWQDDWAQWLFVCTLYVQCIKYHWQSNNCRRLNGRMTFQWMPAVVQHHWCWISFDAAKHLQLWTRQVMHNLVPISMKALLGFWWLQEIRTFIFIFKQP